MEAWTLIRNPSAASGKGERLWQELFPQLDAAGLHYAALRTGYPGHATEMAEKMIADGHRRFISFGGDGTAHEVANGILRQKQVPSSEITLAHLPIGTGNDWGRTIGIPAKVPAAIANLLAEKTRLLDVGLLEKEGDKRYFINVAGMGYDGLVAHTANERKAEGKGGIMGYISALLSCLKAYQAQEIQVRVDGEPVFEGPVFSLCVGICQYNGGGMKQCPRAIPDDGQLDLTLIQDLPKWQVIRNVPRLFSGKFIKNPHVSLHRGQHISITAPSDDPIEVDGESLGSGSAQFTCLPAKLKVIVA